MHQNNRGILGIVIYPLLKGYGSIKIVTTQSAYVYIDGEKIGTSPGEFSHISAGVHSIMIEQPEFFRSPIKNVEVKKGKMVEIGIPIPIGCSVTVTSILPGSDVKIDGQYRGKTPLTIKLPLGKHYTEIGNEKKEFHVYEDEPTIITFNYAKIGNEKKEPHVYEDEF
ncbi:MAG: PEGA domain-containing protein [Desulfamplus sp.]|nr:PEGA domain-containing protein [Desulfamplus sp.]